MSLLVRCNQTEAMWITRGNWLPQWCHQCGHKIKEAHISILEGTPGARPLKRVAGAGIWHPEPPGPAPLEAPSGYSLTYGGDGAWVTVWQQMPRGKRAMTTMETQGLTSDTLEKLIRV